LLLAAIGCLIVLRSKPVHGLVVYIILSMWVPYSMGTFQIGTIDFSVGRIVIIALFIKILSETKLAANFKFIQLDKLVIVLFLAEVAAAAITSEPMKVLEYRSGDFFDMALPYFAIRLIVRSKQHYILILKAIVWSAAILAILAFYESLTGRNLVALGRNLIVPEVRLGYFHRAQSTFRHAIYYGVFSGMAGGICLGLLKNLRARARSYMSLVGLTFLGAFSSMSSGGLLTMAGSLSFVAFYRYRRLWKTTIVAIVLMCAMVEVISNRHFYNVIDRFTFNASTAWYRGRLLEVAFFEGGMSGHWLTGYGFAEPGWGAKIDFGERTDMVNHYLMELSRYGLLGFIPFCAVIVAAIRNLFKGFRSLTNDSDRWFIWCLGSGLFGVLLALNSVSLFEFPMTMLFMMFGLCVALPSIVSKKKAHVPVVEMTGVSIG